MEQADFISSYRSTENHRKTDILAAVVSLRIPLKTQKEKGEERPLSTLVGQEISGIRNNAYIQPGVFKHNPKSSANLS